MPGRDGEAGPGASHLYTDGASRGNPGPSAAAWLVKDPTSDVVRDAGSEYLGRGTNNVAEYMAIVRGLEACARLSVRRVVVLSDSQLCIRQLKGEYRVKNPRLQLLHAEVLELAKEFEEVDFIWMARGNEWIDYCDRMVNKALDEPRGDAFNAATSG